MLFLGVDPGVGGGIAVLNEDGSVASCLKMPELDTEILMALGDVRVSQKQARAVLELVRSSPQQGVVSAFTFGRGYGRLRMALTACGIPYDEITPAVWQKTMQCRTRGDKNVTKRRASELFPAMKITHHIADSLLLAEYCRRKHLGIL